MICLRAFWRSVPGRGRIFYQGKKESDKVRGVSLDTSDSHKKRTDKKVKKQNGNSWAVKVFFLSVCISAVFSFASGEVLEGAGMGLAFCVLAFFILLGILFDIIGVAVTAADERPFHSMAAHKAPGAREALKLIRRANKVSSFCNDGVGDICGIVSGATGAVIVTQLQKSFSTQSVLISVAVTALVSGLTIGGKAMCKPFAMKQSKRVIYLAGRILHLFSRK